MSMDPALRTRLLDLALRAHSALEHYRDILERCDALEERDRVPIKEDVRTAAQECNQFLASAKKMLAENTGNVPQLIQKSSRLSVLEGAVISLKPAMLDAETRAAMRAFEQVGMPGEPFGLRSGVTIVDPKLYHKSILEDMKGGPRWRTGGLLSDLRDLVRIGGKA